MPSMKREATGMMTNCRLPSPLSTVCAAKRMATKRSRFPAAKAAQPPTAYALLPAFWRRHLPSGRRLRGGEGRASVGAGAGAGAGATSRAGGEPGGAAHHRGGCGWPRGTAQVLGAPESVMECATLTLACARGGRCGRCGSAASHSARCGAARRSGSGRDSGAQAHAASQACTPPQHGRPAPHLAKHDEEAACGRRQGAAGRRVRSRRRRARTAAAVGEGGG